MRNLIFFLLLLTALPASSQVVAGNYTPGFYSSVNYVKNPSCILNDANITDASGIVSRTTASPITEGLKASCLIDGTASAQVVKFVMNSFDTDLDGENCSASISYRGDASLYKAYVESPVSTKITPDLQLEDTGSYTHTQIINFPCGVRADAKVLVLETTGASPAAIKVGNAYGGKATNIGSTQLISEPTSYTPTIGLTGGTTSASAKWQRIGTDIEVWGDATFTTVFTGGTATVSLPSVCTIDTSKFPVTPSAAVGIIDSRVYFYDVGSGQYGGTVTYNDTSSVLLRALQDDVGASGDYIFADRNVTTLLPFTWANNDRISFRFKVPCVGWTAQTTASIDAISKRGSILFASGSATNTGALATFNTAAFGTNTPEGQALAPTTANDLGIRMTGAPAGVYEVAATGKFYASSAAGTGTRTVCEYRLYDGTNHSPSAYAIAAGGGATEVNDAVGTITGIFNLSSAGTINVVVRGQRVTGNGTCYAEAGAYLSIKNVSQNSPAIILANNILSASNNGTHFNSSQVGSTGTVTKETGDWISGSCSVGSAVYTCALVAGAFSTDPACHATIFGETTNYNAVVTSASTSTVVVRTFDTANTAAAAAFGLTCSSPR